MAKTPPEIKNIILLIGDGMGLSQAYAAMLAAKEKLNLERAQCIGLSKTYSANDEITDSGAGGTAISIGHKTNNGAIGVDTTGNTLKNFREYAESDGKATGIVVTCDLTHATPASFLAHDDGRYNQTGIASDFFDTDADVLIGGGAHLFDSLGVSKALAEKRYQVTYTIDSIKLNTAEYIACFAAPEHLKSVVGGRGDYLPKAVNIALQKLQQDEDGFFLMVEGSQIDWACHSNNMEYLITEMADFDKAVGVAMDFADKNPGTLVIVTADHETGGLTWIKDEKNVLKASFSTNNHSAVMVPIYSYGTGAENFSGIMENTGIFSKMIQAFGIAY